MKPTMLVRLLCLLFFHSSLAMGAPAISDRTTEAPQASAQEIAQDGKVMFRSIQQNGKFKLIPFTAGVDYSDVPVFHHRSTDHVHAANQNNPSRR